VEQSITQFILLDKFKRLFIAESTNYKPATQF